MEKKITKTISYKLKFMDSARFMESSSSDLVENLASLSEGIHKIKYKDCECFLNYTNA